MMHLLLLMAALELTALDAGVAAPPWACSQNVNGPSGSTLSFTRNKGHLVLGFAGPEESSMGRAFAMKLARAGRTLTVTIAAQSISPSGIELDALGQNYGALELPVLSAGRYTLNLRQGTARAKFMLDVLGDDVSVEPVGTPSPMLTFAENRWRATPADAGVIECRTIAACGADVCVRFIRESTSVRDAPKVEDGRYYALQRSDWSCFVQWSEALRESTIAEFTTQFDDGGCAHVRVDPVEAK